VPPGEKGGDRGAEERAGARGKEAAFIFILSTPSQGLAIAILLDCLYSSIQKMPAEKKGVTRNKPHDMAALDWAGVGSRDTAKLSTRMLPRTRLCVIFLPAQQTQLTKLIDSPSSSGNLDEPGRGNRNKGWWG
jgi:hypothetical protein